MSFAEDTRRFDTYTKIRKRCETCGHSKSIPIFIEKVICEWCGNYVFRDEKVKFKYRLEQAKIKQRRIEK